MKIEGEKRLDLMCEIERLKGLEEQVDKDQKKRHDQLQVC